jgi:hypothetical protein
MYGRSVRGLKIVHLLSGTPPIQFYDRDQFDWLGFVGVSDGRNSVKTCVDYERVLPDLALADYPFNFLKDK